jgi:4-amino-4-deoxy-L-arabinose transferase-like glycosyltransferase
MSASPPKTPAPHPSPPEPPADGPGLGADSPDSAAVRAPSTTTQPRASTQASPSTGARGRAAIPKPSPLAVLGWLALAPVLALSTVLGTHRLAQNGYANVFYSAGVKSMLGSFHNFLFNSFDPGGLVTVDKPPLSLWVQVVSAKLFGFSPLSLLLPEAIVGVITVGVLYAVMHRPFGRLAALAGALTLAVFPSFVAVSRDNGVDPVLILLMLLACGAALRAIRGGRWPALLACAALVGLAFNAKTLAACAVIPGIALGYFLCAPGTLPRRVLKLLAAGILLGAVAFSWTILVEATPASQRPYVGGSTNNTEMNLTFGYNGFGRVEGQVGGPGQIFVRLGAVAPFPQRTRTILSAKRTAAPKHVPNPILPDGHYSNPTPFGVSPGPLRLFEAGLGDQGGWMLPFALLGMLALALAILIAPKELAPDAIDGGPARARGASREPQPSVDGGPAHDAPEEPQPSVDGGPAHDASKEPQPSVEGGRPTHANTATGAPPSWYERTRRDPRTAGLIVLGGWFSAEALILSLSKGIVHPYYVSALGPGTAAMVGAGVGTFAGRSAGGSPIGQRRNWLLLLAPLAIAGTVAAQLVLLDRAHYLHWYYTPLVIGAGVGTLALLSALAVRRLAAPAIVLTLIALTLAPTIYAATTWSVPVEGTFPAAGPRVAGSLGPYGITAHDIKVDRDLMRYIDAHHPTRRWELLTVSSNTSATIILLGGRAGALGGYSGTDPAVDGPQLARMVSHREARYVVLGGAYASRGGNLATKAVIRACREIPNEAWLHFRRYSIYSLVLYDCAGDARRLAAA